MKELLVWKFFAAGYPSCCEAHARNYFMVMWNLGQNFETQFKLSLS